MWSSVSPRQAGTMLVYNRDSLADVSGDLELRFRDAPGVAAVVLPRLRQLLVHKRAIVAFPATIGGRRKYVQAQLRFPNADRTEISSFVALVVDAERPAARAPAGDDDVAAGQRAAPGRLSASSTSRCATPPAR